jgi:hypothetical protein
MTCETTNLLRHAALIRGNHFANRSICRNPSGPSIHVVTLARAAKRDDNE